MSFSPIEYLRHILAETEYLMQQSQKLSKETFIHDETLKRAFVRSLEIIGEATKNVPQDFRQQYPQIEWKAVAGMRDKLIHGYFEVDYDIVWNVVINELPKLQQDIKQIIYQESMDQ